MILSHEHRFIFVKTKKTAGTSIEIALSKFCGEADVITRITREDERLRRQWGGRGPQNELLSRNAYAWSDWWNRLTRKDPEARHYNHEPALEIRRRIGRRTWNSYFKFCVERNPWDRAVSLYYWRTRDVLPRPSLLEFLRTPDAQERLSNDRIYTIGGKVAVDQVLRYENLQEELAGVMRRLGLGDRLELPRAKAQFRGNRGHYSQLFDDEARDIVARLCEREIRRFGYTFQEPAKDSAPLP